MDGEGGAGLPDAPDNLIYAPHSRGYKSGGHGPPLQPNPAVFLKTSSLSRLTP